MKNRGPALIATGIVVVLGSMWLPARPSNGPDLPPAILPALRQVAEANDALAADLYGRFKARKGNLFFSPVAISAALGLVAEGARGATLAELEGVLHHPAGDRTLRPALGLLLRHLASKEAAGDGYELAVASRLWAQRGEPLEAPFVAFARDAFGAEPAAADFAADAERERVGVNRWVAKQTRGFIKDLLPAGAVDARTTLLLANAIYFKADWTKRFERNRTRQEPFRVSREETTTVPMMHRTGSYALGAIDGIKVLELPYRGDEVSMYVFLPDDPDGLAALERRLDAATLRAWMASTGNPREVAVNLPRFRIESDSDLAGALAALGARRAFAQGAADFRGISPGGFHLAAAAHKAVVEVNEEGTTAAAGTWIAARLSAPARFRADHPFLFAIRHEPTGTLLFLGRLTNP